MIKKLFKNEKGISHIATVLIIIVISSFLAFTYFVGDGGADDKAVMPVMQKTATDATESLSNLNKQINQGINK